MNCMDGLLLWCKQPYPGPLLSIVLVVNEEIGGKSMLFFSLLKFAVLMATLG